MQPPSDIQFGDPKNSPQTAISTTIELQKKLQALGNHLSSPTNPPLSQLLGESQETQTVQSPIPVYTDQAITARQ